MNPIVTSCVRLPAQDVSFDDVELGDDNAAHVYEREDKHTTNDHLALAGRGIGNELNWRQLISTTAKQKWHVLREGDLELRGVVSVT